MSQRALVTGGAGFIGSHLVDALLAKGLSVVVLDDFSTGHRHNLPDHPGLTVVEGSVADAPTVERAGKGCGWIAHLAAVVSVQDSIRRPVESHAVNLTGTVNVLETARNEGSKVVFASSAAVYGNNPAPFQSLGGEAVPLSPYGAQKLGSENYVRLYRSLYGVPGTSFRQFNIYGPRQDPSSPYSGVISIFAKAAKEGRDLFVNGDGLQTRDFMFVGDVVDAYLRALESDLDGEPVNIGTGVATTIQSLAKTVIGLVPGCPSAIVRRDPLPGDIRHSCADVAPTRENGWLSGDFVPLHTGLGRTLAAL